ncbi:MAG: hypothetical protein BWK76_12340 [Desulfobulbaceae bacterium A2]|nr:MAG: hypothetical protein BWK76_12340 [Desulfobulbaceae bacterium A2]
MGDGRLWRTLNAGSGLMATPIVTIAIRTGDPVMTKARCAVATPRPSLHNPGQAQKKTNQRPTPQLPQHIVTSSGLISTRDTRKPPAPHLDV